MKIDEILKKESVITDLVGKNKPEVIKEMAQCLKNNNIIKNDQALFETLMEREKLGSTGIGENVAIPHGKSDELTQIITVFVFSVFFGSSSFVFSICFCFCFLSTLAVLYSSATYVNLTSFTTLLI